MSSSLRSCLCRLSWIRCGRWRTTSTLSVGSWSAVTLAGSLSTWWGATRRRLALNLVFSIWFLMGSGMCTHSSRGILMWPRRNYFRGSKKWSWRSTHRLECPHKPRSSRKTKMAIKSMRRLLMAKNRMSQSLPSSGSGSLRNNLSQPKRLRKVIHLLK